MPLAVLSRLQRGNARFVAGLDGAPDPAAPFAAVLSCIDNRVLVEAVFDLPLGRVYSVRVAGHVLSRDVIRSLEYACAVGGARALVVLGHTNCGAVRGACQGTAFGHVTGLLAKIHPAIEAATCDGPRTADNADWVTAVAREHVRQTCDDLLDQSPLLRTRATEGTLGLTGALYDVRTRRVEFLNARANQPEAATGSPDPG